MGAREAECSRLDGKLDDEARARRFVVERTDVAVVIGDDRLDDSEAESGAALFRGKVRLEEPVLQFGRNSVSVVNDLDP